MFASRCLPLLRCHASEGGFIEAFIGGFTFVTCSVGDGKAFDEETRGCRQHFVRHAYDDLHVLSLGVRCIVCFFVCLLSGNNARVTEVQPKKEQRSKEVQPKKGRRSKDVQPQKKQNATAQVGEQEIEEPQPPTTIAARPKPRQKRPPKKKRPRKCSTPDFHLEDEVLLGTDASEGCIVDVDDAEVDADDAHSVSAPLNVDALLGNQDNFSVSQGSDGSNSPMVDVVTMLLSSLPHDAYMYLVKTWKRLSDISATEPLRTSSGCSGSGLDWHVIQTVNEAFAVFITDRCCMFLVMSYG